jgi:hypothetical protein
MIFFLVDSNPQYVVEERQYAVEIKGNVQTSKAGRTVTLDSQVLFNKS